MMHGLINLTRNSKKREQRVFSMIRWLTGLGSIYRIFYLGGQVHGRKTEYGRCPRWAQPTRQAWRALVSCAHQGTLPGSFFISYILKYSKTDKKYFCGFFGVRLLTVSRTSLFHDSGVFRKVSFMCSSGVKVWITLLSTLIGVSEI